MPKIHILGGSGSGKTTLAQHLAARFSIPHYELDWVNLDQESPVALAAQPAWVVEGSYLVTTEPMLYHADYIVLLEISWPVAVWRMITRHIMNSLRRQQSYPGLNGIRLLFLLLKGNHCFYLNKEDADTPPVTALLAYLEEHKEIAAPPTEAFIKMYAEQYRQVIVPPTQEFLQKYLERYKEKVIVIRNNADREHLLKLLS